MLYFATNCNNFTFIQTKLTRFYYTMYTGDKLLMTKEPLKRLESYKYDLQFHKEKTEELEKLKQEITKIQLIIYDKTKKHIEATIEESQLSRLKSTYGEELSTLNAIEASKKNIEKQIESLQQPYKNILYLRYIKDNSFDEIASKMNYSSKRIYQLHKEALDHYTKQTDPTMIS